MIHFPGAPLPVRANSKCSGGAPGVPLNAIMSALAEVAVMKSTNASSKCSGIGMLPSSPERLARLGHRVRARQADIGEQPVIEFAESAALRAPRAIAHERLAHGAQIVLPGNRAETGPRERDGRLGQ